MTNSGRDLNGFSRLPIYLSGISIVMCSLNVSVAGVSDPSENKVAASEYPSFTANYEIKHEPSREIIARYRMTISENGFRIDQQGDGAKASIILSNQLDRMWLLDRTMKQSHEVPIRVAKRPESSVKPEKIFDSAEPRNHEEALIAGFIQFKPCNGMRSRRLSDLEGMSNSMQVWECVLGNNVIEKQWFDTEYGVVVKSESFDGIVATISDIQTILLGAEFFKPPNTYRNVALEALMPGNQALEKYEKNNPLSLRSKELNHSLTESAMEKNNRYTTN